MNRQERRQLKRIFARAGLTADEIMDHPEHGLLVNASGLRKLAAIAPNPGPARVILEWVAQERRKQFRIVDAEPAEP